MQREQISIAKIIVYILVLVAIFVLQTAMGMPVRVFGFRVDILPCFVAAAALLDGPVEGMIVGLAAGILYDVGYSGVEGLYPLYYMLVGITLGFISQKYLRRIFPAMLLTGLGAMLLLGLIRFGFWLLLQREMTPLLYFQALCGEALVAALFSPVAYLLARAISRRFTGEET